MVEWYEYTEDERIKNVYSKYTISDFLKWWQNGADNVMEIRIKNFEKIKQLSQELDLPYSASGVYIHNELQLKAVIKRCRDVDVMWFGYNPRKRGFNKWGTKSFGGSTTNVNSIDFLFIDIDRKNKIDKASNEEIKNCDILANEILKKLSEQKWSERYIKICSGNGIQLLIALDIPVKVPNIEYSMETKSYNFTQEFETIKDILRDGIGREIAQFSKKFNELNVELDVSCFKLAGVCSLPFTKNFKYGGFTWRGIVEIKNGINEGFTDYILLKQRDANTYKSKMLFIKSRSNKIENIIKPEELMQFPLVRLMLDYDLPHGQINNLVWMQIKCLLRDNKIEPGNKYVKELIKELEKKYKDNFTTNYPDKKYEFKEEIINGYCAKNLIPPIFPLNRLRTVKEAFNLNLDWKMKFLGEGHEIQLTGIDIFEDMRMLKDVLIHSVGDMNIIVYKWTIAMIKKWGEEKTKYFFDFWFERYLGYRSC